MPQEKDFQKKLIEILNGYRSNAISSHKKIPFLKFEKYYRGNFSEDKKANINNNYNIIKSLVDTKSTFVLDNQITTSIVPKNVSFANTQSIMDMQSMADILEDVKNEVFKENKIKTLSYKVVRRGIISNMGITKVYWDEDFGELGDVRIEEIQPQNFFPDPSATCIDSANYIFVQYRYSILTLKKKYPDLIEKIEDMARKGDKLSPTGDKVADYTGVISSKNDGGSTQIYATDAATYEGLKRADKTVSIWECYIKDDSIFIEDEHDSKEEEEVKKEARAKYPNGRLIIYSDDGFILEDKPIDYKFGFPFSIFNENPGDSIIPIGGTVRDLVFIQDRLNRAYSRLKELIGKFLSLVVIDGASGINKNDIVRKDVIELNPGSLRDGLAPTILTNNTLAEIQALTAYIESLKENARELARVNDQMISGERPRGVNSGDMVIALNESAMTSIRQIQRNYMDFMIDLTNKVVILIQSYYNMERYVRISTGEIVRFPLREEGAETPEPMQVINFEDNVEKIVKEIKGDLKDYEFKTEIIAGTELPKSRTQFAQLTLDLVEKGILGNPDDIKIKEMILTALDFPNRRAIIEGLKEGQAKEAEAPAEPIDQTLALIEKMGFNFKDLEQFPGAQENILLKLGLIQPIEEPPPPMPEGPPIETPIETATPLPFS